jgi:hypothetical protein
MIQVHVLELFIRPEFAGSPAARIGMFLGGPPAAPMFMAIMGWFLAETARSAGALAGHGIKILALGFTLNLGLNAHLLIRMSRGEFDFLNPLHFVFGVDILFLAGLGILAVAAWRRITGHLPDGLEALLGTALIMGLTPFVNRLCDGATGPTTYPIAYLGGTFAWSYFPVFPWLGYVLLGTAAHGLRGLIEDRLSSVAQLTFAATVMSALLGLAGTAAFATTTNLPAYYHHPPPFFLWTSAFLFTWWMLHAIAERWLGDWILLRAIKWTGRNITAMYVFQWLVIGNLATGIYQSLGPGYWLPATAGATLAAAVLTRLWRKARRVLPSSAEPFGTA